MIEIVRVDIVDGQTLDIELSNGHLILFDFQRIPKTDNKYDALQNLDVLPRPHTDGKNIYWQDGPQIALEEIMYWLSTHDNK